MKSKEQSSVDSSGRSRGARTTDAALEAQYRFVLWLIPAVERIPRSRKLLLGDRIQRSALEALARLVEATYTRRRSIHLAAANLSLEKYRLLFLQAPNLQLL